MQRHRRRHKRIRTTSTEAPAAAAARGDGAAREETESEHLELGMAERLDEKRFQVQNPPCSLVALRLQLSNNQANSFFCLGYYGCIVTKNNNTFGLLYYVLDLRSLKLARFFVCKGIYNMTIMTDRRLLFWQTFSPFMVVCS